MTTPSVLELAHSMPGRVRLRWRGSGEIPSELLARLRSVPQVRHADYRAGSRSLLLQHGGSLDLEELRSVTRPFDVEVTTPPEEPVIPERQSSPVPVGKGEVVVADLEAVLLLGLMATWARDLLVTRTLRVGPLILLVLTGLNLYQYWQRRLEARSTVEDTASDLEVVIA